MSTGAGMPSPRSTDASERDSPRDAGFGTVSEAETTSVKLDDLPRDGQTEPRATVNIRPVVVHDEHLGSFWVPSSHGLGGFDTESGLGRVFLQRKPCASPACAIA